MGYTISNGQIVKTYVSKRGNLVADTNRMHVFAIAGNPWPILYDTAEIATATLNRIQSECSHTWNTLSHEEQKCSKCGAFKFTPDF